MPRHHARRGKRTEHFLDVVHAGYEARGLASITRNHPEMTVVGKAPAGSPPGAVVCIYRAKGAPDFHVQAGPLSILMDCKEHAGTSWPFAKLEEHQARKMDRHEAQHPNARAGLVIRLPDVGACWFVPWSALSARYWSWAKATTRAAPGSASLDVAGLDACGVRLRSVDWLDAVR